MDIHPPPPAAVIASFPGAPAPASIGELLRQLVGAAGTPVAHRDADIPVDGEEILLDVDVDGRRYLLLRLPLARSARPMLSPREQEIARMVAAGVPSKTIASVLNISLWTVGTHLRRIFAKLGVNTRAAMVGKLRESALAPTVRNGGAEEAVAKLVSSEREALRA
jgi:DNA-binding CsgD family transcriptional regulator